MNVVTRFAPSPTGNLHIGGLRTAIFNFLYARRYGGKFLLRIEDTDLARSNVAYLESILQGLKWLSLSHDVLVYQSANVNRHREVALELLNRGKAYHDKGALRIKVNRAEMVSFTDLILGEISADGDSINDVVILRSDGSPTYVLAVVVDDHDMGVTHIIRGSDHITNTLTQKLVYEGMGWSLPDIAHIPLIHNTHGAKLSKRDGAVDVIDYKTAGILPEAMFNYLLRLGWSHGDKEIFSLQEAMDLFDITVVGKSPARFDREKLYSLNSHYIRELPLERIVSEVRSYVGEKMIVSDSAFVAFVELFRKKCSSIVELRDNLRFCWCANFYSEVNKFVLRGVLKLLEDVDWSSGLQRILKEYISLSEFSAKEVYTTLRMALIGQEHSPSVVEIMQIFGKDVVLQKLRDSFRRVSHQ